MQLRSLILAALLCAAGASQAAVHIDCKPARGGRCAAPPAPPAPPLAPAPPAPPPPPMLGSMTAPPPPPVPAVPPLPAIPAPPPPPALPDIPAEAHAACANRAVGSKVTINLGPGETMTGLCERESGKMVFQLRTYHRD